MTVTENLAVGLDLDAAVAEAIGWSWCNIHGRSYLVPPWADEALNESTSWRRGKGGPVALIEDHFPSMYGHWRIPPYSTNPADATRLLKWMQGRGRAVEMHVYPEGGAMARMLAGGSMVEGATWMEALCRHVLALKEAGVV